MLQKDEVCNVVLLLTKIYLKQKEKSIKAYINMYGSPFAVFQHTLIPFSFQFHSGIVIKNFDFYVIRDMRLILT